jgi:hypothetical protein
MPIIAKAPENSDFPNLLAPDGLQAAICSDIVDMGIVEDEYQGTPRSRHMIRIVFLLDEKIPKRWTHPHTSEVVEVSDELAGRPFGVSRRFNLTLHEKGALRQFLKTWRGKDFTPDELMGFDVESLIGVPCALNIVHNQNEHTGKWYANLEGVSRLPKQWTAPTIPDDYQRLQDREPREERKAHATPPPSGTPTSLRHEGGRGPDADFSGEPMPDDDELPF